MAIGELTKQLAQQVIGNPLSEARPAPGPVAENVGATILGQIQAMQKALKEDDELQVLYYAGGEAIRVLELFQPSANVLVMSGVDKARNVTRVVAHVESVQLVSKVVKVQPPARPVRVGIVSPKRPE